MAVRGAVANALAVQNSVTLGAHHAAWTHRILRTRIVAAMRRQRGTATIDELPLAALAAGTAHENRLVMQELGRALARLPAGQREVLPLFVVHALFCDAIAAAAGCAVNTPVSSAHGAPYGPGCWAGRVPACAEVNSPGPVRWRGAAGVRKTSMLCETGRTVIPNICDRERAVVWGINGGLPESLSALTRGRGGRCARSRAERRLSYGHCGG